MKKKVVVGLSGGVDFDGEGGGLRPCMGEYRGAEGADVSGGICVHLGVEGGGDADLVWVAFA